MLKKFGIIGNTIILLFTLCICSFINAAENKVAIPFRPGEKLFFEVRWEFITAGNAVLQILPIKEINDQKVFTFHMTARTTKYVDVFYKVRDTYESYADIKMNHSLHYRKIKKGHRKKDATVKFDWDKNEALYTSPGEIWEPIPLLEGAFDPLSVFYAFRTHHLEVGKEILAPVSDGKKCVEGIARVLKKERIKVKMGEYDAYLVEPDTKDIGGVFEKSKDAKLKIWVTADEKKIPLMIKSKVVVGSFIAELTGVEGL